jgi:hypothetical protein
MSENAPTPASAPVAAPNIAATSNTPPAAGAPAAAPQAAATERQRIALAEAPDDAEVVLRVDGKDVVVSAAEARRRLQTSEAANRRFEEAKKLRQQAEAQSRAIAESLQDPARFREELSAAGYSPREIAEAILKAEIEEANLTPEQRRLRELEREQRKWQAEREQAQRQEFERVTQYHQQVYANAIGNAATLAGVPDSPRIRAVVQGALVSAIGKAIEIGKSLEMADLTALARQAYTEHASDYRAALSPEERRALITEEDVAWYHEQRKAKQPRAVEPTQPSSQPRDERGRYAEAQARKAGGDVNGRAVIRNPMDALAAARART